MTALDLLVALPLKHPDFQEVLRRALLLIVHGNPVVVHTTLRTLHLAVVATAVALLVGVPCGCALGLGGSAATRVLRGVANAMARFPPVGVGVIVLLLLTEQSPWGGGPLAGLGWFATTQAGYLAQTLLAVPIVIALTASAVQGVPGGLLVQARAYGAPYRARAALALREARRAVIAAALVAMGVTITAIGALTVALAPANVRVDGHSEPATLALGAFQAYSAQGPGSEPSAFDASAVSLGAGDTLAAAYATVLIGLFFLIAAALTWLQQARGSWIPGRS